ncbi:GSCOCG00012677001-RA-CDS [Cotesia congregata]|nr:GSCOCG00012677001-RA-CDS [Cotesia congregata]
MKNLWIKYGTCGAKIDGINNQLDYFNKSLELYDKFNMHHLLSNLTMNPGKKCLTEALEGAFKIMLGKKLQIRCVFNRTTKEFYLLGVRLCFDLSFNLIDCEKNKFKGDRFECPEYKEIVYLDDLFN